MEIFFKKLAEVFGVYLIGGMPTHTGAIDWLAVADVSIALASGMVFAYFLIRAAREYLSYKGTTPDLFMGVFCVLGLVMVCLRVRASVTYQSFQYLSVTYCVCSMLALYYFSLMILYTPTILDDPRERQFTRVLTVVFMVVVAICLYASIEYQSSPIFSPRDRANLVQSAIEPILQLECISVKSFVPNLIQCSYCVALCAMMIAHLRKVHMRKTHRVTYVLIMVAYAALCLNSINKIFYENYADLRQSSVDLETYFKGNPSVVNVFVFQAVAWAYGVKDTLEPMSTFLGPHNVFISFTARIIYVVGFAVNATMLLDSKNMKKLEERQLKKLKKFRATRETLALR